MSNLNDLKTIDPDPIQITLSTGTVVELQALKMRQFFKLMRIVSHGAGPSLMSTRISLDDPQDVFIIKLVSLVMFSIPDAEDETVEFLQSMVRPTGLIENRSLNKQDKERNIELWAAFEAELYNPEPEDFVTLLEAIINNEAKDLQALGKRVGAMWQMAQKTGQIPDTLSSQTSQEQTSSAESVEPTTSSPPSTDGPIERSPSSHSDEYVNVSLPSTSGVG